MLFTTTERYLTRISREDLRNRLVGNHLKIHDLDFEVVEKGHKLKIVPHAEEAEDIKTLPITDVELRPTGDATEVVVTSKIRKIDLGGPQLIILFCLFLVGASTVLFMVGRERMEIYAMLSISTLVFSVFWVRMQRGYFDYVRKIRDHVRRTGYCA
ncbi:MAG: hypothetical protein JNM41_14895 [Flavipsychrobacter sp.]|nr:hypothetical protein [Flavipsychrobacter sp.]